MSRSIQWSFLLALSLVACDDGGGGSITDAGLGPVDAAPVDDACPQCPDARVLRPVDAGPPPIGGDAGGPPPMPLRPVDEGCADIYAQDILPVFSIEIDEAEWAAIQEEFSTVREREAAGLPLKPYHPLRAFRYGDEVVADAMIRLKANPHYSWRPPKMQFIISFKEYDEGGRFHGLRKINLDAPWYDPSLIRERVALSFLREAGVPASCANNAVLTVNGEMYALYTNKEQIDREFLERNFEDPDGNLYKYGRELRTNRDEDTQHGRRDALWASTDMATFEQFIVRDQVIKEWAAEAMLPHYDGYWCCNHNYYIYDHPDRGFVFIPHDLDITFADAARRDSADPEIDLIRPSRSAQHFNLAMADPEWRADFNLAVEQLVPFYDPDELLRRIEFYAAQTSAAYAVDPNLPFERSERPRIIEAMREFIVARRAYLDRYLETALACSRGEPGRDLDRDGVDECSDCDDLNRQVKPGLADGCNERDDDCDGRVDEDQVCSDCAVVETAGGNYALCAAPQAWFDGHQTCARQGGVFGIPLDETVRATLAEAAGALDPNPWWTAANDGSYEGRWVDTLGRTIHDPPWAPGQPNGEGEQNCAALDPGRMGAFIDETCLLTLPVICKLPD